MKRNGSDGNSPYKGFLNPINDFAFFIIYRILMFLGVIQNYTLNFTNNLRMPVNNDHEEESDTALSHEDESEQESDTASSHEGAAFGAPVYPADTALGEEEVDLLNERNSEEAVTPFPSNGNSMLEEEGDAVLDNEEDDESATVLGSEGAVADEEVSVIDSNEDDVTEANKEQPIEQEIEPTEIDAVNTLAVVEPILNQPMLLLENGDNTSSLFSGDTNYNADTAT